MQKTSLRALLPDGDGTPSIEAAILSLEYKGTTIKEWISKYENIQNLAKEFNSDPANTEKFSLKEIFNEFETQILNTFKEDVLIAITKQLLIALVPGGGFKKLFDFLVTLVTKAGNLLSQITQLISSLGAALQGAASYVQTKVQAAVSQGLKGFTVLLLTLLERFGLGKLKQKLQDKLKMLQMKFQCILQKFMAWLMGKCGKCAQA